MPPKKKTDIANLLMMRETGAEIPVQKYHDIIRKYVRQEGSEYIEKHGFPQYLASVWNSSPEHKERHHPILNAYNTLYPK